MADFDGFLVSLPAPYFSDAETHAPIVDGFIVESKSFSSSASSFFLPEVVVPPGGHVLDANTIALWRMDEAQGAGDYANIGDASGNGYDMTPVSSGVNVDIVGGPNGVGRARLFRSSSYASHAYDAALTAMFVGECTLEGWFYPTAANADYLWNYGSSGESLATNFLAGVIRGSTGTVSLFMERGSGTNITINSTANLPLETWTHLAVAKEDTGGGNWDYHFYINGAFVDTVSGLGPEGGGTQALYLGRSSSGDYFSGAVGTQRWSNIVRSAGEIAASYARSGKDHAVDASTVIYLPMDELPDLLDEAGLAHLRLTSGTDLPASQLISGEGKSRTFSSAVYQSTDKWEPLTTAFLAAMHDEMTVEFWGRLAAGWENATDRTPWVWSDSSIDGGSPNYNFLSFAMMSADRKGRVFSEHGNGVNDIWYTTAAILDEENQWDTHHFAMTLVASGGFTTYEIYIDGVLMETSDGTDPSHDGGILGYWQIGAWDGHIDDMRVSNKKRTGIEIRDSHLAGIGTIVEEGATITYRMRGYETVLMKNVFWNSTTVDSAGADYPGASGNLVDVGVMRIIGN